MTSAPLGPAVLEEIARIVAELPDPVRLIDRDGATLFVNEAARAIAPQGLGHTCPPQRRRDPSCPGCQLQAVLERGTFERWHVAIDRGGTSADVFEVTLCPVRDRGGALAGVLEILRDVTATLGLENYLISRAEHQDEALTETSRKADTLQAELGALRDEQAEILYRDRLVALNQLVSGLAHEIHTPLGAMLSAADMAERTARRLDEALSSPAGAVRDEVVAKRIETLRASVGIAVDGARRIQAVVRTLRLFSRLDEAEHQRVDLREGLDSTLELLQYRMAGRIAIERDYGEIPPVLCRPEACNQLFMNLLLNAVQAIEGPGIIRVRTRTEGATVAIEIEDNGVGIPPDRLPRLFELGFTTRAGRGGSGIGLALSQRIASEHGGRIDVESRVGRGTTFTVRLPVEPPGKTG